jgi:hypothetical protein
LKSSEFKKLKLNFEPNQNLKSFRNGKDFHSFIHSFKTPTSIFILEFVFQIIKKIGNDENYNLLRKKRAIQLRLLDEK